jgi:site-specific DNA-methyltransferase (adenine-specific)
MLQKRPIAVVKEGAKWLAIGGNQRTRALADLETEVNGDNFVAQYETTPDAQNTLIEYFAKGVPVMDCTDLSPEQQRRFIIADNLPFGEWDTDALANEWDADELKEWGMNLPEWGEGGGGEGLEAKEDDYEMPDEIQTDIVLGDLFEIGSHRLLCGDSTQKQTFEVLFDGQLADAIVTDPPYNVAYEGKTKDKLKIDNDKQEDGDFYKFLYDFYASLAAHTKAGGAWYVWHADSEGANFRRAMKDAGIMVKQCLIWVKNSMVMGRQDYHWKHEPCLYGWKEGAAHGWYSDRKQTTVLNFDRPQRNAEHPTMKPIPLFAYQIGNSSKEGDIIADGFGGSGTTMVACHQMNRRAYLVEFDPKYCQVIVDRMLKLDPTLGIKKNGQPYETAVKQP